MPDLHLSRLRLRTDPATRAILPLLMPVRPGERAGAVHRLVWSLFGDADGDARDYLWREDVRSDGPRTWYTLGPRAPVDGHNLFEVESRPYAPDLHAGDRLSFSLRANATCVRHDGLGQGRGKRVGVVSARTRELRRAGATPGRDVRAGAAESAVLDWMTRTGARDGFSLAKAGVDAFGFDEDGEAPMLRVSSVTAMNVPRGADETLTYEVVEMEGTLVVDDPATFLSAIARGFGRGRAFGLGLMMVRRA